jgi:hypothetical protein
MLLDVSLFACLLFQKLDRTKDNPAVTFDLKLMNTSLQGNVAVVTGGSTEHRSEGIICDI